MDKIDEAREILKMLGMPKASRQIFAAMYCWHCQE